MTDQERANRFVQYDLAAELSGDHDEVQVARDLAEQFSATRLDERRAIVAYLRRWADLTPARMGAAGINEVAGLIERGDHGT